MALYDGPDPHLADEENDLTELYDETGDATDVGMNISMTDEILRATAAGDLADLREDEYEIYQLGDEDDNTDAQDEYEELALEETEGQYGLDIDDLDDGFHIENLDD